MKVSKRMLKFTSLMLLPLIGAVVFWWINHNQTKNEQLQTLPVARVVRGNLEVILRGAGTLQPKEQVAIYLKTNATVKKVYFQEGDVVKKGDLLYELQDDNLETELKKAELNLQQQQLNLNEALKEKQKATIYAPCDGVLKSINVKVGDWVNNNTVLATIVDQDKTQVKVPFNREQIKNIKVGQKAEVLFLDSFYSLEGKVIKVHNVGIPQSNGGVYFYATISLNGNYYVEGQERNVQVTVLTDNGSEQALKAGTIEPLDATEVRSEIAGKVMEVYADEGNIVKKGQKLFSLDTDEIDVNIEKQRLSLQQAQLNYESKLRQVESLKVYAPIDGIILEQNVEEGEQVGNSSSGNSGPAAVIADYSKMEVVIPIDELDINKVKVGMPVKITAEAVPGKTFEGIVEKIAEQGVSQNNVTTFDVTVSLDKTPDLKIGMTMDVAILVAQKNNVLMVPIAAVQQRNDRSYVMLFNDEEPRSRNNNRNNPRLPGRMVEVETGISNEDFVEILSGLKEGDRVLLPSNSGTNGAGLRGNNRMFPPPMGMPFRMR